MDSVPLSMLLESMIQQEQLDWLDVPLPETAEQLYIAPEPNNVPVLPTFHPSPDLSDHVFHELDESGSKSEEDSDDTVNTQSKRKRREIKNQCEAKRRIKFNEQLAALRSLLASDQQQTAKSKKASKITREALLGSAIQEITKLRQELSQMSQLLARPTSDADTPLQRLGVGKFPFFYDPIQFSLFDPHNRAPFTAQDLERAFQVVFAREIDNFCTINHIRTEQTVLHSIKMLEDISKQIGKLEYQLGVGVLEQTYLSTVKFNPKELKRVLENNWSMYQEAKKSDNQNLILFIEGEIGVWILTDMALMEYMTGNIEASERTYCYAKELAKKLGHMGTNHFMLANVAWNLRGPVSVSTAERLLSILQGHQMWCVTGQIALGNSLIATGKHKEGLQALESAINSMVGKGGEQIDLCIGPTLLEAYLYTGSIEKGLCAANYILKKYGELNLEGCMGKSELLRLKANLLMLKKCPEYVPEPHSRVDRQLKSSVEDIMDLCEPSEPIKQPYGPLASSVVLFYLNSPPTDSNDDVEMLLRSAMNLAHTRGLVTIELRCAVDLARYFLHCGYREQALESVQVVKDVVSRMKAKEDMMELQRARHVVSMIEDDQ